MATLSNAEIDAVLQSRAPEWTREGDTISRSVVAADFLAGIDLVRRAAEAAEAANHHPDIDIRWTTITFTLSTHSEGGVTDKDIALAEEIDRLANR